MASHRKWSPERTRPLKGSNIPLKQESSMLPKVRRQNREAPSAYLVQIEERLNQMWDREPAFRYIKRPISKEEQERRNYMLAKRPAHWKWIKQNKQNKRQLLAQAAADKKNVNARKRIVNDARRPKTHSRSQAHGQVQEKLIQRSQIVIGNSNGLGHNTKRVRLRSDPVDSSLRVKEDCYSTNRDRDASQNQYLHRRTPLKIHSTSLKDSRTLSKNFATHHGEIDELSSLQQIVDVSSLGKRVRNADSKMIRRSSAFSNQSTEYHSTDSTVQALQHNFDSHINLERPSQIQAQGHGRHPTDVTQSNTTQADMKANSEYRPQHFHAARSGTVLGSNTGRPRTPKKRRGRNRSGQRQTRKKQQGEAGEPKQTESGQGPEFMPEWVTKVIQQTQEKAGRQRNKLSYYWGIDEKERNVPGGVVGKDNYGHGKDALSLSVFGRGGSAKGGSAKSQARGSGSATSGTPGDNMGKDGKGGSINIHLRHPKGQDAWKGTRG